MIQVICRCGAVATSPEASVGQAIACAGCGSELHLLSGEAIADGAGDFDTRLTIKYGPTQAGHQFFLGGITDIEIGKLPEKHLSLPGALVSRNHCKLQRMDFGPSRWKLRDLGSTNGLFLNQKRTVEAELQNGDMIDVGDYQILFEQVQERVVAPPPVAPFGYKTVAPKAGERACPGCLNVYPAKASVCTQCGINLDTGKPIVISRALDENALAENVDTTVRAVSFFVPFGLFPIASEAFATKKPIATWVIFGFTFLVSLWFFVVTKGIEDNNASPAVLNLMLWNGSDRGTVATVAQQFMPELDKRLDELKKNLAMPNQTKAGRAEIQKQIDHLEETRAKLLDPDALLAAVGDDDRPQVGFHWYQLFTCALLHAGLMHFVGNMVFLLVFGLRVNELIGNFKFVIVYLLLAMGSSLVHHLMALNDPLTPMLGASGAIMGLAGMYLMLFPIQKVHTIIWLRLMWRLPCWYKVFRMGGLWLIGMWVAFNDVLPMVINHLAGSREHVAHWAHLGGLLVGISLASLLLIGRLTNAFGGDLFSVALGKRAWTLIGRPGEVSA